MNKNQLQLLKTQIDNLLSKKDYVLLAIDGNCTAGKTTLASTLAAEYDCNIFHMDDFFLRPEQRTKARYMEIGGNVDYERFHEEIILPLLAHKSFSYRPYDCHTMKLSTPITIVPKALNIIEGTYSLHPKLAYAYDYSVMLTIDEAAQRERIIKRSPQLQDKFFNLWIPLEQKYFESLPANHALLTL